MSLNFILNLTKTLKLILTITLLSIMEFHEQKKFLPNGEDGGYFDALISGKQFNMFDLPSGYWQAELKQADKEKTAFFILSGFHRVSYFDLWTDECTCNISEVDESYVRFDSIQCIVTLTASRSIEGLQKKNLMNKNWNLRESSNRVQN